MLKFGLVWQLCEACSGTGYVSTWWLESGRLVVAGLLLACISVIVFMLAS
jgi:hypothetical protein